MLGQRLIGSWKKEAAWVGLREELPVECLRCVLLPWASLIRKEKLRWREVGNLKVGKWKHTKLPCLGKEGEGVPES